MRRSEPRLIDPSLAHDRIARQAYGVKSPRDIDDDAQTGRELERLPASDRPRITGGYQDGSALRELIAKLEQLGILTDETDIDPDTWQPARANNTGYWTPPGPVAIDATQVTVLASNNSGARYLGMTPFDVSSIEVRVRVTTAVATAISWAEIGLASAASATSGNLTLLGTATDVTGTFNSTGNKSVTFTIDIPAGTFVYLVFGSQATTPFQLRATIADELGSGLTRTASTTRPSTMGAPTAFSTSTALTAAAWATVRWS